MSDLHNLSAPIEESPEEITKVEIKKQEDKKNQSREDFKLLWNEFKGKYLKKLLLSMGIAVTLGLSLLWGGSFIGSLFSTDQTTSQPVIEETQSTPSNENAVKYTRFDGHQYYFYFPDTYSFLNRTRNDDLNEIVFSNESGEVSFILQEFDADNTEESTLDSIYSYIFTTLPPDENAEIQIEGNTFRKRVYKNCEAIEDTTTSSANILSPEEVCNLGKVYYSIYLNGIMVIFETLNTENNNIEREILSTFTKNVIASQILSEEYIFSKLPSVNNKLQALFAFGVPAESVTTGETTEILWNTSGELKMMLKFDSSNSAITKTGTLGDNFEYSLETEIPFTVAKPAYGQLMGNQKIKNEILRNYPDAKLYMDDSTPDNNFWEVSITANSGAGSILVAEYTVDKTTGDLAEKLVN